MTQQTIHLTAVGQGSGRALLEQEKNMGRLSLFLKGYPFLQQEELFKVYTISDGKFQLIGSMDTGEGNFFGVPVDKMDAIAIYRKNIKTSGMTPEFYWVCGEREGSIKKWLAQNPEMSWDGAVQDLFAFMNGGFDWKRINGFYSMYSYDIVSNILSNSQLHQAVMRKGYYLAGDKEEKGTKYIALAFAKYSDLEFPEALRKYKVTLTNEGTLYEVICVGIDKSGEFFVG